MPRPKRPSPPKQSATGKRDARNAGSVRPGRDSSPDAAARTPAKRIPAKRTEPGGGGQRRGQAPRAAPPQLDAPPPQAAFKDRDGELHRFPDSALKRVAARLLDERHKAWRYRPFPFPIFTEKGNEQTFYFDFYVYDNQEAVIRLILVAARDSRELWDRLGRFKRQYPMYHYELWTPEKLAALQAPRAQLGF